jgi:hypothetical protein
MSASAESDRGSNRDNGQAHAATLRAEVRRHEDLRGDRIAGKLPRPRQQREHPAHELATSGVQRSETKRADFWGVNASLDPSNARIRPKNGRNAPVGRRGNPPRRPRGAEVPPSASSLRTPRADTTGSRALVLVCVAKQARANELIAEGDGYTFIATLRSPDLRDTSKRRRHLCYCGNE